MEAFNKMVKTKKNLKKVDFSLIGFLEGTIYPLEVVNLPVLLGEG